ncbi:SdpA family antimicrobial peptide system protein [Curtobacterium sp. MCBD17_030]|uniref:SdpA family antimicrobial peptide system protein n=1 Tax=Curtobacterium sp. MCBD17_030 TaxID=2175649 RepID=UPI000D882857|nr:SdpA family antimicrobial peptide system protein [Curtobacterium sp. MCBD17_030]PYY32398.1 SdpA family antimicrobial peptide system protein [Curtobacterium sp. MCBD17_030]
MAIILGGIVGLTLAFYVMQGAVSFTPAVVPPARNDVVHLTRQIAPQGWAFFTKDAQSAYIVPFEVSRGGLIDRSIAVGASAQWAFGFNRAGRSQGAEIATFLHGVGQRAWTNCGTDETCYAEADAAKPLRVKNPRMEPTLCGRVLLVAQKPVPWEWRFLRATPLPQEAILLDVAC